MCRYGDLLAQGVELHQASMPASSSFSTISSVSNDIAPGTPQRSPTHPPSPTNTGSQAVNNEPMAAAPRHAQPPQTDQAGHHSAVNEPNAIPIGSATNPTQNESAQGNIQPALTYIQSTNQGSVDSSHEPQTLPLLANSASTLLSNKLADPSQLLGQDMMLQSHQREISEADTLGLSQAAVQTGFKAAGKVSMAEGMSEPVTEAIEAVKKNLDGDEAAEDHADSKGRLMEVHSKLLFCMQSCIISGTTIKP